MTDDANVSSELSKIAKLNGDFRRNYGTLLGTSSICVQSFNQRRAWSFFLLDRTAVRCLFGGAGPAIEIRS